jgi:hypothetical protein
MTLARRVAEFWWDFLVGDDWRLTAGVLVATGLTVLLSQVGLAAWWLLPAAIALLLARSLRGGARSRD